MSHTNGDGDASATLDSDFESFKACWLAKGFNDVLERVIAPNTVLETHSHPFEVEAVVARGTMWLTVGGETKELRSGDHFSLRLEEPHAERYGPQGAAYWVARRSAGDLQCQPTAPQHK